MIICYVLQRSDKSICADPLRQKQTETFLFKIENRKAIPLQEHKTGSAN